MTSELNIGDVKAIQKAYLSELKQNPDSLASAKYSGYRYVNTSITDGETHYFPIDVLFQNLSNRGILDKFVKKMESEGFALYEDGHRKSLSVLISDVLSHNISLGLDDELHVYFKKTSNVIEDYEGWLSWMNNLPSYDCIEDFEDLAFINKNRDGSFDYIIHLNCFQVVTPFLDGTPGEIVYEDTMTTVYKHEVSSLSEVVNKVAGGTVAEFSFDPIMLFDINVVWPIVNAYVKGSKSAGDYRVEIDSDYISCLDDFELRKGMIGKMMKIAPCYFSDVKWSKPAKCPSMLESTIYPRLDPTENNIAHLYMKDGKPVIKYMSLGDAACPDGETINEIVDFVLTSFSKLLVKEVYFILDVQKGFFQWAIARKNDDGEYTITLY